MFKRKTGYALAVIVFFFVAAMAWGQSPIQTWKDDTGVIAWEIEGVGGDLLPGASSTRVIGASGYTVEDLFIDQITLGGSAITGWGSVVSPFTDNGTTIVATAVPTKFILTQSTGSLLVTILDTNDITGVTNDQTIDMSTNNKVIFGDNSDTFTIEFDATDTILQSSDGAIVLKSSEADGYVHFKTANDTNDYLIIGTATNVPFISTASGGDDGDLSITADGGDISFGDENLVTTGTLGCGVLTASAYSTDLITGATNGDTLTFGNDILTYESDNSDSILAVNGDESANDASLSLRSDNSDGAGDNWDLMSVASSHSLTFSNDIAVADTQVVKMTLNTTGELTLVGDVLTFGDGEYLTNAEDDTLKLASNDASVIFEVNSTANEGTASIVLASDIDTDAGDQWRIQATASETFVISNDTATADTFVADLTITGSSSLITTAGDLTVAGTTPLVTIGDGGDEDAGIQFDGAKDFYIADENTLDDLIIGYGSAIGTDARITVVDDADHTIVKLGDAVTSMDTQLVWDGNAVDFRASLDDSADSLEIGINSTIETDERITIAGTPTETHITFGDGGSAEDQILIIDGDALDIYLAYDASADDFIIGAGTTVDTTPAITILGDTQAVEVETDLTVSGGNFTMVSAVASQPALSFSNTNDGTTGVVITYNSQDNATEEDAEDGDDILTVNYTGYDDGTPTADTYATMLVEVNDATDTSEDGTVTWTVVNGGSDFEMLGLRGSVGVEVNAGSEDVNFMVDSADQTDLFFTDGGSNDVMVTRNLALGNTDAALLQVLNSNAGDDQGALSVITAAAASALAPAVLIQSSGATVQSSLFVNHDGTTGTSTLAAVVIDTQDVKTAGLYIMSPVDATGTTAQIDDYALTIVSEGIGGGQSIYRNVTGATTALLKLEEVHVESTSELLTIVSAANATTDNDLVTISATASAFNDRALFINDDATAGATTVPAVEIDSERATAASLLVTGLQTEAGSDVQIDEAALCVVAGGVGGAGYFSRSVASATKAILTVQEEEANTTGPALVVLSAQDDTGDDSIVQFTTSDALCDDPLLTVTQVGVGEAITVLGDVVATGDVVNISADGLTTGVALNITSTATTNGDGTLIELRDSGIGTGTPTRIGIDVALSGTGPGSINTASTLSAAGARQNFALVAAAGDIYMGDTSADAGEFVMQDGAQTGDDTAILAMSGDASGDFSITTSDGNISLNATFTDADVIVNCDDGGADIQMMEFDGSIPSVDIGVSGTAVGVTISEAGVLTFYDAGNTHSATLAAATDGSSLLNLTGDLTISSDLTITGDGLNTAGDLLITPTGGQVHINGGLDIGGTTAVADNSLKVTGTIQAGTWVCVTDTTNARSVTNADYGKTLFFTFAGDVTVTLPANGATVGSWFRCVNANSDTTDVLHSAATADTLIAKANATADSVEFGSGERISSSVLFISNGSFWVAINENGACTMTVVDA